MSEIKYPIRYDAGVIWDADDNIVKHTLSDVRSAHSLQEEKNFTLQMIEACNNYYKLKEQNEKLKEALKFLKSFTPDLESIGIDSPFAAAIQHADDTLKSCES